MKGLGWYLTSSGGLSLEPWNYRHFLDRIQSLPNLN
jgi:hypothetical protein